MQQKHIFIMDPQEKLNLQLDSSLRIAFSLSLRGHIPYFCTLDHLQILSPSGKVSASGHEIIFNHSPKDFKFGESTILNFEAAHCIHVRKEPPFDQNYLAMTWILDHLPETIAILNKPQILRDFNEKCGITNYPDATDKVLISSNPETIEQFITNECQGDGVIKPLDLFGGRGIIRFQTSQDTPLTQQLQDGLFRIVQPFNSSIHEGEVRVFTLAGKPIAWCLKKPKPGEFLANTQRGATLEQYTPSDALKDKVTIIAKDMAVQGIFLAGFDIIGDMVSEINITSPRLLVPTGEDEKPYYDQIAQSIEEHCLMLQGYSADKKKSPS